MSCVGERSEKTIFALTIVCLCRKYVWCLDSAFREGEAVQKIFLFRIHVLLTVENTSGAAVVPLEGGASA